MAGKCTGRKHIMNDTQIKDKKNELLDGDTDVLVRKWNDTEWHTPTMEYCYGNTSNEAVSW